jgi:hypothetical protein
LRCFLQLDFCQLVATTGGDHGSAGYQTALRIMMFLFFLLGIK